MLGLMVFSFALFSQTNNTQYESSKNDLRYRNGRHTGGMAVFTVIGGVGCMLAPGVQFNSSVGVSTYGSTTDVLFLTAGVVLIGVGIAMIISNERNRNNFSENTPMLKWETINANNSKQTIKTGFPAVGFTIPIN